MEIQDAHNEAHGSFLWVKGSVANDVQTPKELEHILHLAGRNPTHYDLQKYFLPETKSLPYGDITHIIQKENPFDAEELLQAFKEIGGNMEGYIDFENFITILAMEGEKLSEDYLCDVLEQMACLKNGKVNYLKFCAAVFSAVNTCKRVALTKAEADSAQQKLKSRTFTRKKGTSRPSTATSENSSLNLQSWQNATIRGCFFMKQNSNILSHQYTFELLQDSAVWITLQPRSILEHPRSNIDTELLVFQNGDNPSKPLVAYTTVKDSEGRHCLRADMKKGKYLLIPFSAAAHWNSPPEEVSDRSFLERNKQSLLLTSAYKISLQIIFDLIDLDGNGAINFEEFQIFVHYLKGTCHLNQWQIIKDNFEMLNGDLTFSGFCELCSTESHLDVINIDVLDMLFQMGFNSALQFTNVHGFQLTVNCSACKPILKPLPVSMGKSRIDKAICKVVLEQGNCTKVRNLNDLTLYIYKLPHRAYIIVHNKSHSIVSVRLNCLASQNCFSHRGTLDYTVEVPSRSSVIGHHLLPLNEELPWVVACSETLVK